VTAHQPGPIGRPLRRAQQPPGISRIAVVAHQLNLANSSSARTGPHNPLGAAFPTNGRGLATKLGFRCVQAGCCKRPDDRLPRLVARRLGALRRSCSSAWPAQRRPPNRTGGWPVAVGHRNQRFASDQQLGLITATSTRPGGCSGRSTEVTSATASPGLNLIVLTANCALESMGFPPPFGFGVGASDIWQRKEDSTGATKTS